MTDEQRPIAYVDRDDEVWRTWYKSNGELCLVEDGGDSWLPIATVETHRGPLVPLVREDVVAAREVAAERRGAKSVEEQRPAAYLDRDGDVWLRSVADDGLIEAVPSTCWRSMSDVRANHGPLVPLVRTPVHDPNPIDLGWMSLEDDLTNATNYDDDLTADEKND